MPKNLLKFQNFIFRLLPKSAFEKIGISKADMIRISSSMMNLNFEEDLSNISCPTLIVCGENDKHNIKASKEMNQLINNSELKIIEGAGHEVNVDEPEGLARVLDEFWNIIDRIKINEIKPMTILSKSQSGSLDSKIKLDTFEYYSYTIKKAIYDTLNP